MKKTAKLLSLIMAFVMTAVSLSGCAGGSAEWKVDSETGLTEFLIGGIGPLTGDYANYGTSVKTGAEIAIEEINAAGGVNGFKFVLDFQDSQGDPDSAVSAYGKLIDSGMRVSLGTVLSGECASVVTAAKNDDMLILSPSASAKEAITGNDKAFRVCFNDPAQGVVSADYIAEHNLGKKIAVFYASDIDYSAGLYNSFKDEAAKKGLEIVSVQTFTDSTKTDFSTQINDIKSSGAEIVFLPIYAAEAATFLTQAKGKLTDVTYFGCDGLDGILTKVSDSSLAEGVMMLTPFFADSPEENVQSFVKAYKDKSDGKTPDQFAADGYDAIYAIAEALKKAEVTSENTDDYTSKLVSAMTEITVDGVTGSMTWTADGEPVKEPKVVLIKNGVTTQFGE